MKYLIDTNIVIDFLKGEKRVIEKIDKILESGLALSAVSLAELYHGAEKSTKTRINIKKIDIFTSIPEITILSLDKEIAKVYGKLMDKLERKGVKLAISDMLIASTAKYYKLKILTLDKKHFPRLQDFGLRVELI